MVSFPFFSNSQQKNTPQHINKVNISEATNLENPFKSTPVDNSFLYFQHYRNTPEGTRGQINSEGVGDVEKLKS